MGGIWCARGSIAGATALAWLMVASSAPAADPGDLDLSFGGDGKVHTPILNLADEAASAVAIQADGRIVAAGTRRLTGSSTGDFAVSRYSASGSLHTGFGGDGIVTTNLGNQVVANDVAIQPDGKIVVVGTASASGNDSTDFAIARYRTDGTLDTAFAGDGKRIIDFGFDDEAWGVAIQSDGKIVVVGESLVGDDKDFAVARYNSDGSADGSFDDDGKVTTGFGGDLDGARSVAIQSNGRVVVAGRTDSDGPADYDFAVARYFPNGALDPTFNGDGKASAGFGRSDVANDVAIAPDGKIVLAGYTGINDVEDDDFALARWTSSGAADGGFDDDGKLSTDIAGGDDIARGVAVQSDGKVVAAGVADIGSDTELALVRYATNGEPDAGFGTSGEVRTDFGGDFDGASAVALQTNGKTVVAGSTDLPGHMDFALARYHDNADAAPGTVIDSGPTGTTNDSTPSFTFHSTESSSTLQCAMDSGAFASCTSPRTVSVLVDGAHTFRVRAIDSSAQSDPSPATRTFTVDTNPQTTIDEGPAGLTNDATPTFEFHSDESGSSFECAIGTGAFEDCDSPHTTEALPDGDHTFRVRAIDNDGTPNTDSSPAERSFTVDTTPPDTVLDSGPTGLTDDSTPTFTFHHTEEGSTFQCAVDEGSFSTCSSPRTLSTLSDGPHTFYVRARDAAQNLDPTPAEREFTVDTSAPDTIIDAGPEGMTNDPTPTFAFHATEEATFECAVDAGEFAGCESEHTTTTLADGSHTLYVRATDTTDHTDPFPADRTFIVDTDPPDTAILAGPDGETKRRTARFRFDALGEAVPAFECRLDDSNWKECVSPREYDGLSLGKHVFRVRAIDAAGNADPTPARREFKVVRDD